jgi:hypothetical protein
MFYGYFHFARLIPSVRSLTSKVFLVRLTPLALVSISNLAFRVSEIVVIDKQLLRQDVGAVFP